MDGFLFHNIVTEECFLQQLLIQSMWKGKIDRISLTSQHAFHIDWEDIFTAHELIQAGCMALWEWWNIVDRRGHKNRRHGS